jgi:hypothetical protein
MFLCNEYLFDRDCSVSAAFPYMQNQGTTGPEDVGVLLDCVEIAVLNGAHKPAEEWLTSIGKRTGTPPNRAVVIDLYRFWLALLRKDKTGAKLAFEDWSKDTTVLRESKGDLDWVFNGAKHTLKTSAFDESEKVLLLQMINCLEGSGLPVPKFPDQ